MSRTYIDALVTERVLHLLRTNSGRFMDSLESQAGPELMETAEVRQLNIRVLPSLMEKLDEVSGLLNVSKRSFIEAALTDALVLADSILAEELKALDDPAPFAKRNSQHEE